MSKQSNFLEGPINRTLLTLAVPIVLGQILQSAYQLTDAFWVGRIGASGVAAVSISMPITFLVIALGSGLAFAGSTLTAQYMGAGKMEEVNHVAGQTMLLVICLSTVLGLTGFYTSPYLLRLIGVEETVYDSALSFLHVSFIGIIFVFSYAMFQALMRGIGQVKVPLYIVAGTVTLNFILDPLLIFGYGDFEGFGVTGAAYATLITQGIATLLGMKILFRGRFGIKIKLQNLKPDIDYIRRAVYLGVPGSVELSARAMGLVVLSFLVASFGTVTIASYGVGSNILQLVMIPAMGLSMAVSTMVGQNLGANKVDRAEKVTIVGTLWGFVSLSIIGAVCYLFAPRIVAVFIPEDAEVVALGAEFIRTMSLTWGFIGVQLCVVSAFRASGNMVNTMVLSLLSQWVLQFPLAYVLSKHTVLDVAGIWYSFAVTNVVIALISVAWFARGRWKLTRLVEDDREVATISEDALLEVSDHRVS